VVFPGKRATIDLGPLGIVCTGYLTRVNGPSSRLRSERGEPAVLNR